MQVIPVFYIHRSEDVARVAMLQLLFGNIQSKEGAVKFLPISISNVKLCSKKWQMQIKKIKNLAFEVYSKKK